MRSAARLLAILVFTGAVGAFMSVFAAPAQAAEVALPAPSPTAVAGSAADRVSAAAPAAPAPVASAPEPVAQASQSAAQAVEPVKQTAQPATAAATETVAPVVKAAAETAQPVGATVTRTVESTATEVTETTRPVVAAITRTLEPAVSKVTAPMMPASAAASLPSGRASGAGVSNAADRGAASIVPSPEAVPSIGWETAAVFSALSRHPRSPMTAEFPSPPWPQTSPGAAFAVSSATSPADAHTSLPDAPSPFDIGVGLSSGFAANAQLLSLLALFSLFTLVIPRLGRRLCPTPDRAWSHPHVLLIERPG